MKKTCSVCGEEKPEEEFRKHSCCKNGRAGWCKKCATEYVKQYKRNHSEKISTMRRLRYAETEGLEVKEREIRRRELHPIRVRAQTIRSGLLERARATGCRIDKVLFTAEYFFDMLQKIKSCPCCGKEFDVTYKKDGMRKDTSPSVDKIIPSKGSVSGNVAIICWRCNRIKCDATSSELKSIAAWLDGWGKEA